MERPGEHLDEASSSSAATVRDGPDDPQGLLDHLLDTLVPAGGAADDVALLTLFNLPVPEEFRAEFPAEPESLALDPQHAAPLAGARRRGRPRDRRDHDRVRRGGHERDRARRHHERRPFEVAGQRDGTVIEIAVHDRGSWRSEREDDHGRGLDLMRTLMDTVAVQPGEQGTTVSLRRRLGQRGGDAS